MGVADFVGRFLGQSPKRVANEGHAAWRHGAPSGPHGGPWGPLRRHGKPGGPMGPRGIPAGVLLGAQFALCDVSCSVRCSLRLLSTGSASDVWEALRAGIGVEIVTIGYKKLSDFSDTAGWVPPQQPSPENEDVLRGIEQLSSDQLTVDVVKAGLAALGVDRAPERCAEADQKHKNIML